MLDVYNYMLDYSNNIVKKNTGLISGSALIILFSDLIKNIAAIPASTAGFQHPRSTPGGGGA